MSSRRRAGGIAALAVLACWATPAPAGAEPLPANVFPPQVNGAAVDGQTLTVAPGVWAVTFGAGEVRHRWQRCDAAGAGCADIAGATGSRYVLGAGDVGRTIRVVETAANAAGTTEEASAPTAPVRPVAPAPRGVPRISGDPQDGQVLTATGVSWTGTGPPVTAYAFRWMRCDKTGRTCAPIAGARDETYVLARGDVGRTLRVVQSASNSAGSASATSSAAGPVRSRRGDRPPPLVPGFGGPQLVRPVSGVVLVKLRGAREFVRVETLTLIPDGSTVKTLNGVTDVIVADDAAVRSRSTIRARGGTFVVHQSTGRRPVTDLKLADPLVCGPVRGAKHVQARASARRRRLYSRARGSFRTSGRYASAIVRGTGWLIEDTCDHTRVRTFQGLVEVRDALKRLTVLVPAGRSYLAQR
ncbi:MAG TPA: hypothetical protein VNB64_13200 [Solirubrobacteraceae bacterium]|nr:hypothetical protein [Solirubrobacteraceae bacterium]